MKSLTEYLWFEVPGRRIATGKSCQE